MERGSLSGEALSLLESDDIEFGAYVFERMWQQKWQKWGQVDRMCVKWVKWGWAAVSYCKNEKSEESNAVFRA